MNPPEWLSDPAALRIWTATLARLERRGLLAGADPERLAAYAFCMSQVVQVSADPEKAELAKLWRRGAIFAANGLGLWKPKPISHFELLLDDSTGGEVTFYLRPEWEIENLDRAENKHAKS
jgi:phage terminase small subunit